MNIIISNDYEEMLASLELESLTEKNGQFSIENVINAVKNVHFQRLIIDITAIKNYQDVKNFQKLALHVNPNKIILLIPEALPESRNNQFLSALISVGIFNFPKDLNGVTYLLKHPNSYRDVAHIHQLGNETSEVRTQIVSRKVKIIGIKNVTAHAGATTFTYMLKTQLENAGIRTLAIEVGQNDFAAYKKEDTMISIRRDNLSAAILKYQDQFDVILIDFNDSDNIEICNEVLYLIEPTIVKLGRLLRINRGIFAQLHNKKIVLNQSFMTDDDVIDFEIETKTKVFYNVPTLDESKPEYSVLDGLLFKLGLIKKSSESTKGFTFFKIFKK